MSCVGAGTPAPPAPPASVSASSRCVWCVCFERSIRTTTKTFRRRGRIARTKTNCTCASPPQRVCRVDAADGCAAEGALWQVTAERGGSSEQRQPMALGWGTQAAACVVAAKCSDAGRTHAVGGRLTSRGRLQGTDFCAEPSNEHDADERAMRKSRNRCVFYRARSGEAGHGQRFLSDRGRHDAPRHPSEKAVLRTRIVPLDRQLAPGPRETCARRPSCCNPRGAPWPTPLRRHRKQRKATVRCSVSVPRQFAFRLPGWSKFDQIGWEAARR